MTIESELRALLLEYKGCGPISISRAELRALADRVEAVERDAARLLACWDQLFTDVGDPATKLDRVRKAVDRFAAIKEQADADRQG